MKKAFTLIEILVVATIIGLLAAGASVSYSQFMKQSRDARRKADLEEIRSALEMYRSNDENGLYPLSLTMACDSTAAIAFGSNTYLSRIPHDPKCTDSTYFYKSNDGTTYTLAAQLEGTASQCTTGLPAGSCGTGLACNYCLGPTGEK